ncbi:MAG TPA: M15 family metallopeptidase [Micavibrio sp.]|nr:M15 family metallopeptidase [Micavibrio sp.]
MSKVIDPRDLVPMDLLAGEPMAIDLVYANAGHPENIFGAAVYHPDARLILHKDLARIVLLAARLLHAQYGWTLILKDGLRPVEAQAALIETGIVKANPHWLGEPRLLSGPGMGGHPRGMAIDVSVEGVDMGTVFDAMIPQSARSYRGFDPDILENRARLEMAFVESARKLGLPLLPLASEWWDFRLPAAYSGTFAPLSDADLPGPLKICGKPVADAAWDDHFAGLAKSIPLSV